MGVTGSRQSNVSVPVPVTVHIYDMGTDPEVQALNRVLRVLGAGAFHCGVEVYGREWSFRGKREGSGTGVFNCRPRSCEGHSYLESQYMGRSTLSEAEVRKLIDALEAEWPGEGYDLLKRNCCHFVDALCKCLGVGSIPEWITNLAGTGACIAEAGEYIEMRRRALSARMARGMQEDICSDMCSISCMPEFCTGFSPPIRRVQRRRVTGDDPSYRDVEYSPMDPQRPTSVGDAVQQPTERSPCL
mmetsp:Transcript_45723/g.130519  ORF Transcript_45723/g.130519 Transcript_45723/m.130519 type:complete len:244 (-) Transcript_45723:236-967(-)